MGHTFLLRNPEQEEEQYLGNSPVPELSEFNDDITNKESDVMDEFEGIFGIEDTGSSKSWEFMDWGAFRFEEDDESCQKVSQMGSYLQETHCLDNVKRENYGFWDNYDKETKKLSLNLNYQEVLDAWSDKRSHFADAYVLQKANEGYMGEVPIMEDDKTRRKASVMRYKEKRQSRLFSKKIRYQVRKLNADNRPRLKGRFVKRVP